MAGPSKNQKEIEEKRQKSYAYPRHWPGWSQEPAPTAATDHEGASNHPPAVTATNSAQNAHNQGSRVPAAGPWRQTTQEHLPCQPGGMMQHQIGQARTVEDWRAGQARHAPPAHSAPPAPPSRPTPPARPVPPAATGNPSNQSGGDRKRDRHYRPMDPLLTGKSRNADVDPKIKEDWGFSPNYQGDVFNPNNRSDHIREEDSTSLYFYNLHPVMTVKELLDALIPLGPFGKIQQCNIKPPAPERGYHMSGAKVAMFHRREAEILKAMIDNTHNPVYVKGVKAFVRWNTQKVQDFGINHQGKMYMSRTLEIKGPKHLVNVEGLYNFWTQKFLFDLQDVFLVYEDNNVRHLRWVFASVLAQSEQAFLTLKESAFNGRVHFEYGKDPLELTEREVRQWNSQAHLLPALGNFQHTNAHPDLPNTHRSGAPGNSNTQNQNSTAAWEQFEEEYDENIYDAED